MTWVLLYMLGTTVLMKNILCSLTKRWIINPHIIIDDGGDLVNLLHTTRTDAKERLLGGSEETTTGVHRLYALEHAKQLTFPMIAVNDSNCKYLFDNRYGTGQSVWDGIMRTTNLNSSRQKML